METKEGKKKKKKDGIMAVQNGFQILSLEVSYGNEVGCGIGWGGGGGGAKEDGETWVVTIAEATFFFRFFSILF